jgi:excisionase family DNA binding protein
MSAIRKVHGHPIKLDDLTPYEQRLFAQYMGPTEAAEALGVPTRTIIRWTDEGKLRAIQTPVGRLYQRTELERWRVSRAERRVKRARRGKPHADG